MKKRIRKKVAKRMGLDPNAHLVGSAHSKRPNLAPSGGHGGGGGATGAPAQQPPSSLGARVVTEIGAIAGATKAVIGEVSEQAKDAALAIEQKAEHLLEKVPLVGETAARALHKLTPKG